MCFHQRTRHRGSAAENCRKDQKSGWFVVSSPLSPGLHWCSALLQRLKLDLIDEANLLTGSRLAKPDPGRCRKAREAYPPPEDSKLRIFCAND